MVASFSPLFPSLSFTLEKFHTSEYYPRDTEETLKLANKQKEILPSVFERLYVWVKLTPSTQQCNVQV